MSASDMFAQEIAAKVIAALRDEVPVRDLVSIRGAIGANEARVHQLLSDAMDRMRMEVAA